MDMFMGGLASVAGVFAFFGGIALLTWINSRENRRKREIEHIERMKALELGQPLPDAEVARASAAAHRAWAAGLVGLLVPLMLAGSAVGTTVLVLEHADAWIHLPLCCVIWGVVGVTSIVTVSVSVGAMTYSRKKDNENEGLKDKHYAERIKAY